MAPRIAVVSLDNRFLRWTDRREVHANKLPHRSVGVMLHNASGDLLIQRRHREKLTFPGYWDISCAGHVEEPDYAAGPDDDLDRVYETVARRELFEELGIHVEVKRLGRFPPEPGVHYEQTHLFRAEHEGPFRLQEDEVEEARFVTPAAFEAMARDPHEKVTPSLLWFVNWARNNT